VAEVQPQGPLRPSRQALWRPARQALQLRALLPRQRRNPLTGQPEYSPTSKQRSEILTWLEGGHKATEAVRERRAAGPTFGELARRWRAGVENGSIAKRRGRGRYSPTTWRRYGHSLD
jgi:hypothetical protein